MDDRAALHALAHALGVYTSYMDGLGNVVEVADETLMRICSAMGAPITGGGATAALEAHLASRDGAVIDPVMVAWGGKLEVMLPRHDDTQVELCLEHGETLSLRPVDGMISHSLTAGYHRLTVMAAGRVATSTVIAAPIQAHRAASTTRGWGVSAQLAALRSHRSRTLGDLHDLETFGRWLREQGADLVTLLPLLPTFNTMPTEPSPYSPVSRLFWSELLLDLGEQHHATGPVDLLDVAAAHAEVWSALVERECPAEAWHDPELIRYARFRGAQARMGRNWRDWPQPAREGDLTDEQVDATVMRFHLIAQSTASSQLHALRERLTPHGLRLGLDLTVGVHPDGYDAWSRQRLFAPAMSVGAPPDPGFPSGQDWGFSPILPTASRAEGHRYVAQSLAHQMTVAGVLRVDHIMAFARLYWIPHGMALHQGTYVSYPSEELFAVLTLESERHRCEVVGENLGTVPAEINDALVRHRIWGMYLAQFQATGEDGAESPRAEDVASIGSHDTPTLAGWLTGDDIDERMLHGLLSAEAADAARMEREAAVTRLTTMLGVAPDDAAELLLAWLGWLGGSPAGMVMPWLEDLWLEARSVNVPGTPSSARANWQRPMSQLLGDVMTDAFVMACLRTLREARA